MFEEVPRSRRGLARWSTRRVVLGPFAIGGGVLLATIGGSVAVAATVFTATTIVASDVPPKPLHHPVVIASTPHSTHPGTPSRASKGSSRLATTSAIPSQSPSGPLTVVERQSEGSITRSATARATSAAPSSSATSSAASPTATATTSPTSSASGPAGNATIYVSGYDTSSQRVLFEFATVDSGAGSGSGQHYTVSSQQQFSASIAGDITITSGGRLCPPAGSRCTVAQLIAGAQQGFFADVAIDAQAALHSVIELDNATATAQSSPSTSPSASAGRSGIAQPTASPAG